MGINLYVLSIPFVSIKSVNKILKFICILPTLPNFNHSTVQQNNFVQKQFPLFLDLHFAQ